MRTRISVLLILLLSGIWVVCAEAKIARGGGGMRSAVGNRSGGANISRSNVNRGSVQRGNIDRNVNRNVNRDINRNINRDIDRDIDVDVDGWGRGFYYDDHDWGWGSFAAGAAAGAIGAAIIDDEPDTVVVAPSTGTYVTTLPPGCAVVSDGGGTIYDCNGVYYQPSYQGSSLMYQVVQ
jgi:hypothetical protein